MRDFERHFFEVEDYFDTEDTWKQQLDRVIKEATADSERDLFFEYPPTNRNWRLENTW